MKLKVILFGITSILFGITQAQVSKEKFEKAVDLLNCKTVELSLPEENVQQFQEVCPCLETNFSRINTFLESLGKLDATIALSNEVEGLKKSYKGNWKKEEVVSFLSERIFKDSKYLKIVAFSEKRNGKPEFDSYITNLKSDLTNILENKNEQVPPNLTNSNTEQSTLEDNIVELEKKMLKKKDIGVLGEFADYLILFSILLGILALILTIRKLNYKDTEPSNEIKNYIKDKIDGAKWNKSTQNINVGSTELKEAIIKIKDLESQIEKIKSQSSNSNQVSNYTVQPTIQEVKQPEIITQIFFLSTPNSDGSFNESSSSSTYKDGATIYRFTKIGSNRAKFQIDEKDASARLALQYPDKNIDPVCDAVNAFNPKATRITTVELGEAELQNGKWIVNKNQKAKIRYEN